MDKRTIDQFKGSEREIDLINNRALIDGVEYQITDKTFDNGQIRLTINGEFKGTDILRFEIKDFTTKSNHYLIAMSTINKSDTFFTRLKNRIKIIKYFYLISYGNA